MRNIDPDRLIIVEVLKKLVSRTAPKIHNRAKAILFREFIGKSIHLILPFVAIGGVIEIAFLRPMLIAIVDVVVVPAAGLA